MFTTLSLVPTRTFYQYAFVIGQYLYGNVRQVDALMVTFELWINRRIVKSCHLKLVLAKANRLLSRFIRKPNPRTRNDSDRNYLVIAFSRGRFIRG
ncbi:hypothetical protein BDR04DRAFT_1097673 [Suillus decipiens]|nr:hypothetical protein BDR04DRAFT_1097673 [Suillus decipiens]